MKVENTQSAQRFTSSDLNPTFISKDNKELSLCARKGK